MDAGHTTCPSAFINARWEAALFMPTRMCAAPLAFAAQVRQWQLRPAFLGLTLATVLPSWC